MTALDPETVVRGFLDDVVNGGHTDGLDRYRVHDASWHGGSMGE